MLALDLGHRQLRIAAVLVNPNGTLDLPLIETHPLRFAQNAQGAIFVGAAADAVERPQRGPADFIDWREPVRPSAPVSLKSSWGGPALDLGFGVPRTRLLYELMAWLRRRLPKGHGEGCRCCDTMLIAVDHGTGAQRRRDLEVAARAVGFADVTVQSAPVLAATQWARGWQEPLPKLLVCDCGAVKTEAALLQWRRDAYEVVDSLYVPRLGTRAVEDRLFDRLLAEAASDVRLRGAETCMRQQEREHRAALRALKENFARTGEGGVLSFEGFDASQWVVPEGAPTRTCAEEPPDPGNPAEWLAYCQEYGWPAPRGQRKSKGDGRSAVERRPSVFRPPSPHAPLELRPEVWQETFAELLIEPLRQRVLPWLRAHAQKRRGVPLLLLGGPSAYAPLWRLFVESGFLLTELGKPSMQALRARLEGEAAPASVWQDVLVIEGARAELLRQHSLDGAVVSLDAFRAAQASTTGEAPKPASEGSGAHVLPLGRWAADVPADALARIAEATKLAEQRLAALAGKPKPNQVLGYRDTAGFVFCLGEPRSERAWRLFHDGRIAPVMPSWAAPLLDHGRLLDEVALHLGVDRRWVASLLALIARDLEG